MLRVDAEHAGQRLDNFLLRELKGAPKTLVYRVIRSGEVRVNKGRAGADTRLASGDAVRVPPLRLSEPAATPAPAREFPLVFEDEDLLVIDKPAGVAVHGGSGLSYGVIEQLRRARPQLRFLELVHRLDKETSGLLMLAKRRRALIAVQDQLRARSAGKRYVALVAGVWPARLKVIDAPLHKSLDAEGARHVRVVDTDHEAARRSITLVSIRQRYQDYSLLDVTLKTGRTHQIRVHLAHAGHAIVGDPKYGDFALNRQFARGEALPGTRFARMFLHAASLSLTHPTSGAALELHAPLPPECQSLLGRLAEPH